jgi:hypothetical protein
MWTFVKKIETKIENSKFRATKVWMVRDKKNIFNPLRNDYK